MVIAVIWQSKLHLATDSVAIANLVQYECCPGFLSVRKCSYHTYNVRFATHVLIRTVYSLPALLDKTWCYSGLAVVCGRSLIDDIGHHSSLIVAFDTSHTPLKLGPFSKPVTCKCCSSYSLGVRAWKAHISRFHNRINTMGPKWLSLRLYANWKALFDSHITMIFASILTEKIKHNDYANVS